MMMLTMDTSTLVMGVAVVSETHLLGEVVTNQKKNHSVRLMPTVQSLLQELDIAPRDLDAIAVASGPGSYTGVRIGVTTAKTMAWSLQIPLVGVSTLMGMAASLGPIEGWISPLIDARRGRVYTGLYRWEEGRIQRARPEVVTDLHNWITNVLLPLDGPIWVTGDDLLLHRELFDSLAEEHATRGRFIFPAPELRLPRPSVIGRLAVAAIQQPSEADGQEIVVVQGEEVHRFVPRYLQKTQAEKNLALDERGEFTTPAVTRGAVADER